MNSERLEYLRRLRAGSPAGEAAVLAEFRELVSTVGGRLLEHPQPPVKPAASCWSCPSCEAQNSLREPRCRFCGHQYSDEYRSDSE